MIRLCLKSSVGCVIRNWEALVDHTVGSGTSAQTTAEQDTLWSRFKAQAACVWEREVLIACEKGLRAEEAFVCEPVWDNAPWLPCCFAFCSWPLFSLLKFGEPLNTLHTICCITHIHTRTQTFIQDELAVHRVIIFLQGIMTCGSFSLRPVESHIWNVIYSFSKTTEDRGQLDQVKYEPVLKLECLLWDSYFKCHYLCMYFYSLCFQERY